jgi:hypothetical protein
VVVWQNQAAEIPRHDELDGEKVSADHTVESELYVGCGMNGVCPEGVYGWK